MIKNYVKTAWRNLLRNKLYGAINIGGLAIGMAVSLLLLLYVYSEFTYNGMHTKVDRIYKVMHNQPREDGIGTGDDTPAQLAEAMQKDYADLDKVVRTNNGYNILTGYSDVNVKLNFMAADPAVLDVFSFDFVKGNKRTALSNVSSVVLTQAGAKALFGNADPIGKVIRVNNYKSGMKVSAVIKDHPVNSSFTFKMLISWDAYATLQPWVKNSSWGNYAFSTFALLKPNVSVDTFNKKLKGMVKRYDSNHLKNVVG